MNRSWYVQVLLPIIRPVLTLESECWPLSKEDGNVLQIFEIRILRIMYGLINKDGIWRTRYNNELYTFYNELDTVKVIKLGRLRWLGHRFRMQERDPTRKLTSHKPKGILHVGKNRFWWLESVEEDLKNMGVRNRRCKVTVENSRGQFWKRLRSTKDCNAKRRRLISQNCIPWEMKSRLNLQWEECLLPFSPGSFIFPSATKKYIWNHDSSCCFEWV